MNNNQHHYLNELNFPTNRDLKNLFGSFYNLLDLPESRDVSSWNNFEPKLEVKENKESVNVTAEIPGMNENDIDLKNSYENKEGGSYFSEISYGSFKRTVSLPWDLDFDKADASYDNGLLKVYIPKSKEEKTKVKKLNVKKASK